MATFGTFTDNSTLKASELNDFFRFTNFTPTFKQSNTLPNTTFYARYFQVNKIVVVNFAWANNSLTQGISNNRIELTLPITALSRNVCHLGSGHYWDNNATNMIRISAVQFNTTTVAFLADDATSITNYLGLTGSAVSQSEGLDRISCTFVYEAA